MKPEDTTTSTVQEETQASETTQLEAPEAQAVQDTEDVQDSTQTTETEDSSASSDDSTSDEAELFAWAEKKNVKTDDPIALLKMLRDGDKKVHAASQEVKQLRESFDSMGQEQGLDDTSILLNRLQVTDFYLNNPEARNYDDKMAQIVNEKPYLANDLATVYKLAKFESAESEMLARSQQVKKETLAQVAKAESAAPPEGTASTRDTIPSQPTDDDIAKMSLAEYEAWKKQTGYNPFVAN